MIYWFKINFYVAAMPVLKTKSFTSLKELPGLQGQTYQS